jgi:aminopeptidase-like protein
MRTPHGRYPEYHTSADDLEFIRPEKLEDSLGKLLAICALLDRNRTYVNLSPKGEPQLGKRGLYEAIGGDIDKQKSQLAMLWVLNQSDGTNSLLDIAERSGIPFDEIEGVAGVLRDHELLTEARA